MATATTTEAKWVPTYCYNCVAGPDMLTVKVEDGVATEVAPNFCGKGIHPGDGKPCVKAYGLIQKTYSPHRVLTPMRRTNPRKGIGEDPRFEPISWDEALDIVAQRLVAVREKGLVDEAGLPRVAVSLGHGGTPSNYMGTFPAFMAAWGPIDFSFGSGQGVKCVHSEHLYGEYWHRAFTVSADTPFCDYNVAFGANVEVTGGVAAVARHADARVRGMKRVYVEPHMSVSAACSAEWIPIRPKTDGAFMFAMIHVLLHERARDHLDLAFLRDRTASPYLVGPHGYYLRENATGKPLLWDTLRQAAVPFDTPGTVPALEGRFTVAHAYEQGPDDDRWVQSGVQADPSFARLVEHVRGYTPEWAQAICEVPAERIRRVANEFVDHAHIGETVEIDGETLPFRPVSVTLGKTVNNGWGAFDCVWARTVLAVLVGALEVPGGTLGTTIRINRPHDNRHLSVKPGEDGFMVHSLNPTDPERWMRKPGGRNAHRTLVPLVGNGPWAQALGPTHLAWMWQKDAPANLMNPAFPEVWITFRTNPAISFWDTRGLAETIARFPFMVSFAYTVDETNWMADILLPEATDLESLQLIRLGRTKFVEQYWHHEGFILRQPVVAPRGEARDFTWISTELARLTGLLEAYNSAINRGAGGVPPFRGEGFDYSLDPARVHSVDEIWDAACRAATAGLTGGREVRDLAWFRENGFFSQPYSRRGWYLTPTLARLNLRYELPYQERLTRSGRELERRLHEQGIHWWDDQLTEYQFLPAWHDLPARWERALVNQGAQPKDYPFWLLTTKSMQFHASGNASIQMMDEVSRNVRGHGGVVINARTAGQLGIEEGDLVEVVSPVNTTRGCAIVNQGIRPDTLLIVGQFDHWATPYARDRIKSPSLNTVAPMSMELTDATGSGADVVRVALRRVGASRRP
ncbi:MAG: molybdopterin-dependent oxidoreductase [Burkholderiaceae bacterium]|jgi:phenylacetyl-CoA:acceptor oxidoreductase|nr:molybdopterin-dependent oxidoreductase [Burkholderiaceae bacterium]MEB2351927.1 molybdopterin-dependent oxidoreductase [Burkholderiaceae bacterium]